MNRSNPKRCHAKPSRGRPRRPTVETLPCHCSQPRRHLPQSKPDAETAVGVPLITSVSEWMISETDAAIAELASRFSENLRASSNVPNPLVKNPCAALFSRNDLFWTPCFFRGFLESDGEACGEESK